MNPKKSSQLGLWAAATACFALAAAEPLWRAVSVSRAAGLAALILWIGLWLTFSLARPWTYRVAGLALAMAGALACAGFLWLAFEHWFTLAPALRQESLTESGRRLFWAAAASLCWLPSCLLLSRLALVGLLGTCGALASLVFGVRSPF